MTLREFRALVDRCEGVREWMNSRTALLCAVIVNMHRDPKSKPVKVEDFMPRRKHTEEQTPEAMLAIVQLLNAAHGGKVVTDGFCEN